MVERPHYGIAGLRDNRDLYRNLGPVEKAKKLAEIEACPVAIELIARNGAKAMIGRYARVINWFDHCREVIAGAGREDLASSLAQPKLRLPDEPLGEHSDNWLPQDSDKVAYRSASAYFIGRLFNTYLTQKDQTQRLNKQEADEALRGATVEAGSEVELLVNFAENLAKLNVAKELDPEVLQKRQVGLLTRVLGLGKLQEDNQLTEYGQISEAVAASPTLGAVYASLKPQQLDEYKIYTQTRVERFLKPEDFGSGKVMGDELGLELLCPMERLLVSAWRHGCPRPKSVAREYGVEWTRARYDSCDFAFGLMVNMAGDLN